MSWLKRVLGFLSADTKRPQKPVKPIVINVPIDISVPHEEAPAPQKIERVKKPRKPWKAWKQATAERAMRLSGMVVINEASIEYFTRKAKAGFINYTTLVRDGDIMDAAQKKAAGLKTRAKVGVRFAEHLNDAGKNDPVGAASMVALIINRQNETLTYLGKPPHFLDGDTRRKFFPSNMAAGPCPRAAKLKDALIQPWDADILPFDDCPHPDQCACTYESKDFK